MNRSDSERIATVLENIGYLPTSNQNEANLIVINMCSVRQSAVDRVYGKVQKIQKLKTNRHTLKAILTGCILKKDLEKFKNHFDYVLSVKSLKLWPEFLKEEKYFYYPNPRDPEFNEKSRIDYLKIKSKNLNNFSAFIPISTGCNNFCSYCVVPSARGPEFSRPPEGIIQEVKNLVKGDCKEIWLLGQNVNSYGIQHETDAEQDTKLMRKINFAGLLRMANNVRGNFWIRFTSSHPKDFSDELIETMAKCKKITPYLNLPVQSGDNKILKKMNRTYTVKHYKNLVKKIRNAFKKHRKDLEKNIFLSTDVIVGFPGEAKKQFENTAKLFKEIKFDMAYISQYSPRPETTAAKMKDNVSKKEKTQREKILTEILKKTAFQNSKKFIGKELEVLVEAEKRGYLRGKTRSYKTVKLKGSKNLIGNFVKVKIIDAIPWGLKGKLIKKTTAD